MTKNLIDTDLYVRFIRTGRYHQEIQRIYSEQTSTIYFSSVVLEELLAGSIDQRGRQNVHLLVLPFEKVGRIVTPSHSAWKDSGAAISALRQLRPDLRSKLPTLINDALIAMSAREIGAVIYTSNRTDFELIRSIKPFSLRTIEA